MAIIRTLIFLFIFLGLCAGIIILQVHLSKRERMWPGLIMPIVTLSISLLILFGMAAFTTSTGVAHVESVRLEAMPTDEYDAVAMRERYHGVLIEQHLVAYGTIGRTQIVSFPRITFMFVVLNIPTVILLAIYAGCRGKRRRQRSLELMSVQDLE